MNLRTRNRWPVCCLPALLIATALLASAQLPKNITGVVSDLRGQPIPGAAVFIRNSSTGVTRTHTSDDSGVYAVYGLPPEVDYEIYAEFKGKESARRIVSGFLNRVDNVVNIELDVTIIAGADAGDSESGNVRLETFDRVGLRGSFELPEGIPAPIPSALLLHGYGESRAVWTGLEERLLAEGWAVLALDLRGHGESLQRNSETIAPDPLWRTDARQFPLDLAPALDWLKTQPRLDSRRIAVIGVDVGANLALIASARFPEVHTAVAVNPNLAEALELTGTAREFVPKMAHLVVSDRESGQEIRTFVQGASRITVSPVSGGTAEWVSSGTIDEIVRWLRDSY